MQSIDASSTVSGNAFRMLDTQPEHSEGGAHVHGNGVRCATDSVGYRTPKGRPPTEIVVDASEGFIPLWEKDTTLRWRFQKRSMAKFANSGMASEEIRKLMGEAILAWGPSAPVKFKEDNDTWDFQVVVKKADDCDMSGCVLASAFFPDAGRHELAIYPRLLLESRAEQVETLVHEFGHIFGLRHFFAKISEGAWPAEIFGEHKPFTVMNYGSNSKLTKADISDLASLYQSAWAGDLKEINGTPIRLMKPYHKSGTKPAPLSMLSRIDIR
jgi:hypothetical protein